MDKSSYVVLASEIRSQLDHVDAVHALVEQRAGEQGPAGVESLGFQLHNFYCACEDLFEIIASAFENNIETGGGYHVELLKRMRMPISGVRPRVASDELFALLDSLRGFRHVFRHAYGVPLDERKVRVVLDDARSTHQILRDEIESFLASFQVR